MSEIEVALTRAGACESVHRVVAAVRFLDDRPPPSFGDAGTVTYWHSSMKPFQALPIARSGVLERLGLGPEALALACASHYGEPQHTEVVRSVLEAVELPEGALACGPHRPLGDDAALRLDSMGRLPAGIHNNCSGQHAAMLALSAACGWPLNGYHEPGHPLQRMILDELAEWVDDGGILRWGVDGCGLPTPALSLEAMAIAYAKFMASADLAVRAVVTAMTEHPTLVAGPAALSSNIMRVTSGRLIAKAGAEGIFCVAGDGWGAAFKALDGSRRAIGPAVVHVLSAQSMLAPLETDQLEAFARPRIENTRGEEVAVIAVVERAGEQRDLGRSRRSHARSV